MDQWLDSLSEDWISQPRSPHSSSLVKGASTSTSTTSQSRIPRYTPRSTSITSNTSRADFGKSNLVRSSSLNENALREKTLSNINASQRRLRNAQIKPQHLNTASMRFRSRHASSGSLHSGALDTVQHKSSPVKQKDAQATPEWKRRVLKENAGGDLFSPIGLESVFKPPTVNAKAKGQPTGKRKTLRRESIRSSPPPCPSIAHQGHSASGTNFPKPATVSPPRSDLHEEEGYPEDTPVRSNVRSAIAKSGRGEDVQDASTLARPDDVAGDLTPSPCPPPLLPGTLPPRPLAASGPASSALNPGNKEDTGSFSAHDRSHNENISPFFVSRHNTVDGRVEYAAVDISMQRLRSEMDKLRLQQQNIPNSRSSDHEIDYSELRPSERSLLRERLDEVTSQSLPDDLSMGTDAYAANGGFVSIHRGGYSNDGSFQRRPVSPSLLPDPDVSSLKSRSSTGNFVLESPRSPEHFSQTKSKTPSSPPQTPEHNNAVNPNSYERPRSSGSPLKLFDKYDTFTNDRLARRISKFEQTLNQDLDGESVQEPSSPSPRRRRQYRPSQETPHNDSSKDRRISSFGEGQLDGHQFLPHQAFGSHSLLEKTEQDIEYRHPPRQRSNGSQSKLLSRRSPANSDIDGTRKLKVRIGKSGGSSEQSHGHENHTGGFRGNASGEDSTQVTPSQREALRTATGKRLPYLPVKDPAPKRRRTLQMSADLDKVIIASHNRETNQPPIHQVHSRKRKDAIYDNDRQVADPSTLAMRQILQPRVPVQTLTGSSAKLRARSRVNEQSGTELGKQSNDTKADQDLNPATDQPTQIVAGALASVALNTVQNITYGSRKASVTTADFFNEAQQIMQLIRAKGRPRSSHTTAEASVVEHLTIAEESIVDDSTKDEFSRPPSRERGSLPRRRASKQMDARVVSQLRKFEDEEDLGLALSSSLKVLQIHESLKEPDKRADHHPTNCHHHSNTESDPPNIRIREGITRSHKRRFTSSTDDASIAGTERRHRSPESQSISGPSSSRSNPTGSSQSSNRMVIAPETVAHLLSDQMAGMVFDRQKQMWIKRKSSPNADGIENDAHSVPEETEEDLFGDIPDLSVDEIKESQRVKKAVSSVQLLGVEDDRISTHDQVTSNEIPGKAIANGDAVDDIRPTTANGKSIEPVENSSAPSKYSQFASSGPAPGTRATSWGDEPEPIGAVQPPACGPRRIPTDLNNEHVGEVEHEISILEGRGSRTPRRQKNYLQARVVTVAFSSPLVDQRELPHGQNDSSHVWKEESELSIDESSPIHNTHQKSSSARRASFGIFNNSGQRKASRRASISNQSYMARPMSRLDERDELSLVQHSLDDRHMTMEVAVSTPLPMSRNLLLPPPTTDHRSSTFLRLSPLSEFTLHQTDKPIDLSLRKVANMGGIKSQKADNKLSLAAQDLVKKLTDLEPYEPYWDFLRGLDLHDRSLRTLHMLEDFCGHLEELDVSNNQIGELDGIPHTVRLLNIRENCLSDLAAWNRLQNLQYIDVSGNQLKSLEGFQSLIHLRALKAEDNDMATLNGIEDLDGLTSLSLKGNKLRTVDFEDFDLRRLTYMDLRENELTEVANLHRLTALETCDLSYNALEALDFTISIPLLRLQALSVSNNRLSFIDLAEIPNIKTVNLDKNSIASIESLSNLKSLETLSWREQTLITAYGFSEVQYQHCYEIRNLYLSGNRLSTFAPITPFLNLHHLELASTGLQSLSPEFGRKCPNLRIININYNAIRDLRPLLGIVKLQRLFLAGNRLTRLRRTISVLQYFGKTLLEIDMRSNPLTVGFYTPQEPAPKEECVALQRHNIRRDGDEEDPQAKRIEAFLLPALNKKLDDTSRERLDEDTKLRRRVHELLVIHACPHVERMDGLDVNKKVVRKRDDVWERLVELGVLNEKAIVGG